MKGKKHFSKLLAVMLVITMMMGITPFTVMAVTTGSALHFNSTDGLCYYYDSWNHVDSTQYTGQPDSWSWDPTTRTLTLTDFVWSVAVDDNTTSTAVMLDNDITLDIEGHSYISAVCSAISTAGISAFGNLTITGNGILDVYACGKPYQVDFSGHADGIRMNEEYKTVYITGGATVNITARTTNTTYGRADGVVGNCTLVDGSLTIITDLWLTWNYLTVTAPAYTYWTNLVAADPGGSGTSYPGGEPFTVADSYKFVRIITRQLSTDATLSTLAVSAGTLIPAFNPNTTDYAVTVSNSVNSIDITAAASNSEATISGAGTKNLLVGDNKFVISVTAEDKTTVKIYTVTVTRKDVNDPGFTLSGSVSSLASLRATTLELYGGGSASPAYTTTIEPTADKSSLPQSFAFANVEPGTYSLVITKPGHLKYTVNNINVTDGDIGLGTISLVCGDIDGDGQINSIDLSLLLADYGKSGAALKGSLADLDGDGQVNSIDLALLLAGYGRSNITVN